MAQILAYQSRARARVKPQGPTHEEYDYWFDIWRRIRDCVAGEDVIKAQGETYLPKQAGMTTAEYQAYLLHGSFFNATARTIEGLLGSIFRKDVEISDAPKKLDFDAVTKDRQPFSVFVKTLAEEVLSMGRVGVLLDRPAVDNEPPYFATYATENIINWREAEIDGRVVLDQVILSERGSRVPLNGLGVENYERLRVLELDEEGYYRQRVFEDAGDLNNFEVVYPTKRGVRMDFIPFIFFGPKSLSPAVEKPPILDVANLNMSHYISTAELNHGRRHTAMPVYYITGAGNDEAEFEVGPNRVWKLDKEDKVGIVEYTGAGLSYLENAVADYEKQIFSLGGKLISQQKRTSSQSEMLIELMQMGEEAILLSLTNNLNVGLTRLVRWAAWWEGEEDSKASIEVNQKFTADEITARELRAVQALWKDRLLPLDVMFKIFRNAGVVPTSYSLEEFKRLLEQEGQTPELVAQGGTMATPAGVIKQPGMETEKSSEKPDDKKKEQTDEE